MHQRCPGSLYPPMPIHRNNRGRGPSGEDRSSRWSLSIYDGGCWGDAAASPISTTITIPDLCLCNSPPPRPQSLQHLPWLQIRLCPETASEPPATVPLARREGVVGGGNSQQGRVGGGRQDLGRMEEGRETGPGGEGQLPRVEGRVIGPRVLGHREQAPGTAQGVLRPLWPMPKPMGDSDGSFLSKSYKKARHQNPLILGTGALGLAHLQGYPCEAGGSGGCWRGEGSGPEAGLPPPQSRPTL